MSACQKKVFCWHGLKDFLLHINRLTLIHKLVEEGEKFNKSEIFIYYFSVISNYVVEYYSGVRRSVIFCICCAGFVKRMCWSGVRCTVAAAASVVLTLSQGELTVESCCMDYSWHLNTALRPEAAGTGANTRDLAPTLRNTAPSTTKQKKQVLFCVKVFVGVVCECCGVTSDPWRPRQLQQQRSSLCQLGV